MPMGAASPSFTLYSLWGTVTEVAPGMVKIAGISELAGVGNEIIIEKQDTSILGEILSISGDCVTALLYSPATRSGSETLSRSSRNRASNLVITGWDRLSTTVGTLPAPRQRPCQYGPRTAD
jgi:hypothetical protein